MCVYLVVAHVLGAPPEGPALPDLLVGCFQGRCVGCVNERLVDRLNGGQGCGTTRPYIHAYIYAYAEIAHQRGHAAEDGALPSRSRIHPTTNRLIDTRHTQTWIIKYIYLYVHDKKKIRTSVDMQPRTKVVRREHCQERCEKKRCMSPKQTMILA